MGKKVLFLRPSRYYFYSRQLIYKEDAKQFLIKENLNILEVHYIKLTDRNIHITCNYFVLTVLQYDATMQCGSQSADRD